MEKKLPKVFANPIGKDIKNNETIFYSKEKNEIPRFEKGLSVMQKINQIFRSPKYVYKVEAEIKLKDKEVTKRIVGKNKNYLITIENERIPISEILDIKLKQ